jgi:hypothetical protein
VADDPPYSLTGSVVEREEEHAMKADCRISLRLDAALQ